MLGRAALFVKAAAGLLVHAYSRRKGGGILNEFLLVVLLLAVVIVAAYFYLKRRQQHVHVDQTGGAVEHRHPHDPKSDEGEHSH